MPAVLDFLASGGGADDAEAEGEYRSALRFVVDEAEGAEQHACVGVVACRRVELAAVERPEDALGEVGAVAMTPVPNS
jgi:hypothetical protein